MSGGINAVTLAWALSALLFLLCLWKPGADGTARRRRHAAMAGVVLLAAATLYSIDVVNLPEIAGTLVAGAAAGLLLARGLPARALPVLMTSFAGMLGLSAVCVALAAHLNPYAFGLIDERSESVGIGDAVMLGLAVLTGVLACLGGIIAIAGVLRRSLGGTVLLAMTGAMAGWSAAAVAFLLDNMGLVIAGGVAGGAGTVLAIRLCDGATRKGLADAERHP